MTDRESMLAAIAAAPDDDIPRLVYADKIHETGDEDRAEFIRVQCEIDRTPHRKLSPYPDGSHRQDCRHDCPACPLVRRSQELLGNHFGDWLGPDVSAGLLLSNPPGRLADRHSNATRSLTFRRGFVEQAERPAADWIAHADGLLAEHPVQDVWLTTWPEIKYVDGDSTTTDAFGEQTVYRRAARWGDKTASAGRAVGRREIHERYVRGGDAAVADLSARIRRDLEQMMSPLSLLRQWWPQVPAGGWHLPPERQENRYQNRSGIAEGWVHVGDFVEPGTSPGRFRRGINRIVGIATESAADGERFTYTTNNLAPLPNT